MKTLIVGGNSSLGAALVPVLSAECDVKTAGRAGCDVTLDVTAPFDDLHVPDDVDVVIHMAAHFGGISPQKILEAENVNVLGTLKVCMAAARANVKHVVLISSIFSSLSENAPNFGIYALSKRHSEDVARLFCSITSMPLAILRPSQIYGAGARFRAHHPFLHAMMDKAKRGEDIVLHGARPARRNFIYVDDLTAVITRVVQLRLVGTYACQHPNDVTYLQVANAAFEVFNNGGRVRFAPDEADTPDNVVEGDDSLYRTIGFYPNTSIREGLRRIAEQS